MLTGLLLVLETGALGVKQLNSILTLQIYCDLFNYFNSRQSTQKTETCCSSLGQLKALTGMSFIWNSFVLDL